MLSVYSAACHRDLKNRENITGVPQVNPPIILRPRKNKGGGGNMVFHLKYTGKSQNLEKQGGYFGGGVILVELE